MLLTASVLGGPSLLGGVLSGLCTPCTLAPLPVLKPACFSQDWVMALFCPRAPYVPWEGPAYVPSATKGVWISR